MAGTLDFAGMVPGYDFLQSLMKGAGATLPTMGQWVAPTLDPEELDKRIQELRTVQFWLEQNAKLLGASIQALEVQRMTLATLKTMNMPMAELKDALSIKPAAAEGRASATTASASAPAQAVDPVQWWGALTQQFSQIAAQAMTPSPAAAAAAAASSAAAPPPAATAAPRKAAARRSRSAAR